MPIVPAVCPNCGGALQLDRIHKSGICDYCGVSFLSEDAINNFNNFSHNTANIAHADTVIVNDERSTEARLRSADVNLNVHKRYEAAFKIYKSVTEDNSGDHRAWWGMLRCATRDFDPILFDEGGSKAEFSKLAEYKQAAFRTAPDDIRARLEKKWAEFMEKNIERSSLKLAEHESEMERLKKCEAEQDRAIHESSSEKEQLKAQREELEGRLRTIRSRKEKTEQLSGAPGGIGFMLAAISFAVGLQIAVFSGKTSGELIFWLIPVLSALAVYRLSGAVQKKRRETEVGVINAELSEYERELEKLKLCETKEGIRLSTSELEIVRTRAAILNEAYETDKLREGLKLMKAELAGV